MEEQRARELVDRYADAIIRLGYTWLGDLDDAKDICQEVLLKLLTDGRTFPDRGQERAWVIRVAVNQCKNWKKSAWFRRRAPLEEGLHLSVEAPEPEDGWIHLVRRPDTPLDVENLASISVCGVEIPLT